MSNVFDIFTKNIIETDSLDFKEMVDNAWDFSLYDKYIPDEHSIQPGRLVTEIFSDGSCWSNLYEDDNLELIKQQCVGIIKAIEKHKKK